MMFLPHDGYRDYRTPFFIVHADDRAVTLLSECGQERIRRFEEWHVAHGVVYSCLSPDTLCLYGDPSLWTIRTWNSRVSSISYADRRIYPLTADGWDDSIPLFFDLIDAHGIAASSINAMALNLWRMTLDTSVYFRETVTADRSLGVAAAQVGGRKEAQRGRFFHRVEYDIEAAYPSAMAFPIPSTLAQVSESFTQRLDLDRDEWEGIAEARVRIPPTEWGPLPVVVDPESELSCYGWTKANEWATVRLPLSELRLARQSGCDVVASRVHLGTGESRAFAGWLATVVPLLRSLPSVAGAIGKLTANRLWSCFSISPSGRRREHVFVDGRMVTRDLPADPPRMVARRAETAYVGALVQSRVRQRLYTEGLMTLPDVSYVDTDGVICRPSSNVASGWRVKTVMRSVEIAGAQAIRYDCDRCLPPPDGHGGPHWRVAGATSVTAKSRLFRLLAKEDALLMLNIGNVLPSQDVNAIASVPKACVDSASADALSFLSAP